MPQFDIAVSTSRPAANAARTCSAASILVPVDFSSNSKKALRFAATMAESLGAELRVIHVIHDPLDAPGFYNKRSKECTLVPMEDRAEEMMQEFLTDATKEDASRAAIENAHVEMFVGLPVSRILELEKTLEPMLLVMGSQGRTGLSRVFIGSTAEQVARLCRGPVLIVKD